MRSRQGQATRRGPQGGAGSCVLPDPSTQPDNDRNGGSEREQHRQEGYEHESAARVTSVGLQAHPGRIDLPSERAVEARQGLSLAVRRSENSALVITVVVVLGVYDAVLAVVRLEVGDEARRGVPRVEQSGTT